MTSILERKISSVSSSGSLGSHHWHLEPVPELSKPLVLSEPKTQESKKKKDKSIRVETSSLQVDESDAHLLQKRADRFKDNVSLATSSSSSSLDHSKKRKHGHSDLAGGEFEADSLRIIGTCSFLEKDYFRLTSAPDPSSVRPEHVLRRAMDSLKKKWKARSVEYVYMCSQLKAVRQDLTVQHIVNGW